MITKQEISEKIKEQFATVKERSRVLARALRERAEITATRRRLRGTFADLGEAVYAKMANDQGAWGEDADLADFRKRIEGIRAELRQRERTLKKIMDGSIGAEDGGGEAGRE